ncbi:MAG: heme biosynthesis protein HemY [Alphaproteobacteria bacterium]|nr:heme biosynthesis protein HemY [Alphaproteobacteria bacterium]
MIRAVAFILQAGLVVAAVVWLADQPGTVAIEWLGWRIDTSVGMMLLALALAAGAAWGALRALSALLSAPSDMLSWRRSTRMQKGYRALTRGMVAIAAGDPVDATKQAKVAQDLLRDDPLALLLAAEAAQLSGDGEVARKHFGSMLDEPDTEFLGVRGLLVQALRAGDETEALALARRAVALRPRTAWALRVLLDLQARAGQWIEAGETLQVAAREHALDAAAARRKRALLLFMRGAEAERSGHALDARQLLREAVTHDPALVPALTKLAALYADEGRFRASVKLLERAWTETPAVEIAQAYLKARARGRGFLGTKLDGDGGAAIKFAERLEKLRPDHPESMLAVAEAALLHGDHVLARRKLDAAQATQVPPSARLCRLMAQIEGAPGGNAANVRRWLERAADASAPVWTCTACGALADRWAPTCGTCRSFDTLRRHEPHAVADERAAPAASPAPGTALAPLTPGANAPVTTGAKT